MTAPTNYPSKAELLACLPPKLLRFKPAKAWGSLFMSLSLSLAAYGLGTRLFGTLSLVFYLLLGWPLYPLFGITGGERLRHTKLPLLVRFALSQRPATAVPWRLQAADTAFESRAGGHASGP